MLRGMSTYREMTPEALERAAEVAEKVKTMRAIYLAALEQRAQVVRQFRDTCGWTQRQVAEAFGVAPAVIATIDKRAKGNDNG